MSRSVPCGPQLTLTVFLGLGSGGCAQPPSPAEPVEAAAADPSHPLDPLTAGELERAVEILSVAGRLGPEARFALIDLAEPSKQQVREDLESGAPFRRSARAMVYDWATHVASEAVVALTSGDVTSWSDHEDDEPPVRRLVISRLNEVVKADPDWQRAVRGLGVRDLSRVNVLANVDEDTRLEIVDGERFATGVAFMMDERMESMGIPVFARVNLTRGDVVEVDTRDAPWRASDRRAEDRGREALRPLDIQQPLGVSFSIDGSEVRWQNWRFRYGVHPRRGLELFDVTYADDGEDRPVLYRASVSETLTPYGDPRWTVWYPIDEGDYGFGTHGIRSAVPGADAPPNAVFRPAVLHDHEGQPYAVPRAVTFYERDGGVLWRHAEESRRSRELVVSFLSAIDNYDYVFNWIFRQDASLRVEVQLTGIINAGNTDIDRDTTVFRAETRRYRTLVAPRITGPNHQHFFSYRLDLDVDGPGGNSVLEVDVDADPVGPANPDGHWYAMRERVLPTELAARRPLRAAASRTWRVVNGTRSNTLGQPTGFSLMPGGNAFPAAAPGSPSRAKLGFVDWHLWVTPFEPAEMHAGGDYLQPGVRGGGLPAWTAADRPVADADVVLWYTLGITHQVRPEDHPLMPVHTAGFSLVPFGFFTANPALDVGGP